VVVKVGLGLLGLIALTIGFVALAGSRLPVEHTAARSVMVPVAPEAAFATIADFGAAPRWRTGLDSVAIDEGPPRRVTEISGSDRLSLEVVSSTPPVGLVTRIVGAGAFGGSWEYRVAPEEGGSRVTITERGEVYNPIFRFMSAYLIGHTATLDQYLGDLARKLGGDGAIQ